MIYGLFHTCILITDKKFNSTEKPLHLTTQQYLKPSQKNLENSSGTAPAATKANAGMVGQVAQRCFSMTSVLWIISFLILYGVSDYST